MLMLRLAVITLHDNATIYFAELRRHYFSLFIRCAFHDICHRYYALMPFIFSRSFTYAQRAPCARL